MGALWGDALLLAKEKSVNLVLLDPAEVEDSPTVRLEGRRAVHIRTVLRASVGDVLRVGVVNGLIGEATVDVLDRQFVQLTVRCNTAPPPASKIRLVLGLPRPRVVRRVVAAVASMGVKQVSLVGGYRVEKSYWSSPLLSDESLREAAILGLEQGKDTRLPELSKHRLFKPFVDDVLPDFGRDSRRLICHPGQAEPCPSQVSGPITLVIGPDGGWTDFEVERFCASGYERVQMGPRVLRVETAVSAILGRLMFL
jgi:16S rRNA (uracil1498-N3)-methyltransferase